MWEGREGEALVSQGVVVQDELLKKGESPQALQRAVRGGEGRGGKGEGRGGRGEGRERGGKGKPLHRSMMPTM